MAYMHFQPLHVCIPIFFLQDLNRKKIYDSLLFWSSFAHKIIPVAFLFVCFVVNLIPSAVYLPETPLMDHFLFSSTNINLLLFFDFHLILRVKLSKHGFRLSSWTLYYFSLFFRYQVQRGKLITYLNSRPTYHFLCKVPFICVCVCYLYVYVIFPLHVKAHFHFIPPSLLVPTRIFFSFFFFFFGGRGFYCHDLLTSLLHFWLF